MLTRARTSSMSFRRIRPGTRRFYVRGPPATCRLRPAAARRLPPPTTCARRPPPAANRLPPATCHLPPTTQRPPPAAFHRPHTSEIQEFNAERARIARVGGPSGSGLLNSRHEAGKLTGAKPAGESILRVCADQSPVPSHGRLVRQRRDLVDNRTASGDIRGGARPICGEAGFQGGRTACP